MHAIYTSKILALPVQFFFFSFVIYIEEIALILLFTIKCKILYVYSNCSLNNDMVIQYRNICTCSKLAFKMDKMRDQLKKYHLRVTAKYLWYTIIQFECIWLNAKFSENVVREMIPKNFENKNLQRVRNFLFVWITYLYQYSFYIHQNGLKWVMTIGFTSSSPVYPLYLYLKVLWVPVITVNPLVR